MLTRPDLTSRVHAIIRAHFAATGHRPQPGEITDATTFADLGADSLDTIEIVMAIETAFDLECPDHVADELKTVGAVVTWLLAQETRAAVPA